MTIGTTVYLAWYDFRQQTEHICKGEVIDNELYNGTKWEHHLHVRFQPPGLSAPICHHFTADRLSEDDTNVPHDDCYLVCGKKTRAFEHDHTVRRGSATSTVPPSDAWQQVQRFKLDHWDYDHSHLQIEHLDEFYRLWRDAIAAKLGYSCQRPTVSPSVPIAVVPKSDTTVPATPVASAAGTKLTAKQKRSTGAIQYQDAIQTSFFE